MNLTHPDIAGLRISYMNKAIYNSDDKNQTLASVESVQITRHIDLCNKSSIANDWYTSADARPLHEFRSGRQSLLMWKENTSNNDL